MKDTLMNDSLMKYTVLKYTVLKYTVKCSICGEQIKHPATHDPWLDIRKVRLARG